MNFGARKRGNNLEDRLTTSQWEQAAEAYKSRIPGMARQRFRSIPGLDADDMESELWEVLFIAVTKYDPNKGASFKTFYDNLVNNRMRDLVRAAFRDVRKANTHCAYLDTEEVRVVVEGITSEPSAEDVVMALATVREHKPVRRRK